jgi:hypothetical protein
MRTILTIDDDVLDLLSHLRKNGDASLKDLVNEGLRIGLRDMANRRKRRQPFRTRSVSLGGVRTAGIDDIGEVLSIAEGEVLG